MTPPLCLCRVRDFTFLPHLLESGKPSKQITVADLAQKILLTTDASIEEVLNQSIERLEEETHYDQLRQQLQKHLEDTGNKSCAAPAPKPPDAHQHKPPQEDQEARNASPHRPNPANTAHPQPRIPQHLSGAPSSDGRPKKTRTTPGASPLHWEQHPVVPTPMQWTPLSQSLLSGPAGRHPVVANHQPLSHIPTHKPHTRRKPTNSSLSSLPK